MYNRPDDDWMPMSLQDWVASASELYFGDDYLKSAINVALLLAKQVRQMVASGDLSLPDISVENVMIFVKNAHILSVEAVRFELDAPGVLPHKSQPLSTPQSECAALGKILLELFSKGRSHSDASVAAKTLLLNSGMPLSICRLVCDLLDSSSSSHETSPSSSVAGRCILMEAVIRDLSNMKTHPQGFLYEHSCPQKALDDTFFSQGTDDIIYHLYGSEISDSLMRAKRNIFSHVSTMDSVSSQDTFLCETVFVSGSTTDDKTSLLDSLINACNAEEWFVIKCKLDTQTAPHLSLAKALDDFFRKYGSKNNDEPLDAAPNSMMSSFRQVCSVMFTTVDNEMFSQICQSITPSLSKVFPAIATKSGSQETESIDPAQFMRLFHALFKSLCSSGRPVLITLDGLSESSLFVLDVLSEFVNQENDGPSRISHGTHNRKQGMLVAGTFDPQEQACITKKIKYIKHSKKTTVTELSIHSLDKDDLAEILSRNLFLPTRYTEDLAKIVYKKTRGHPSFVLSFLRSIIRAKLLTFSVESRRWVWLNDSISNEQICQGVAKLLIKRFAQLPKPLVKTLQIISCLGCQEVDTVVINALNQGGEILPFDMKHELDLAEAEGLVEKAGTRYSFSHILIKQAIYDSIQAKNRKLLHKIIGKALLKNAADDPEVHLIGTDQVNIYCRDEALGPDEYAECVSMNISAANYLIGESKFEQAQPYIDIGMKLVQKCPPSGSNSEASLHCSAASHGGKESHVHFEGFELPTPVDGRPSDNSHLVDRSPTDTMASHLSHLGPYESAKPTCNSRPHNDNSELPPLTTVLSPDDLVFIQVLLQYLERDDKAAFDLTKMVIKDCQRKHSTGDSKFESLTHAIKDRVRNTVGERHWAKAIAFQTQLFINQQQKKEAVAVTAVAGTGSTPQEKDSNSYDQKHAESIPQRWQLRVKKRKKSRSSSGYGSSSSTGYSSDSSIDSPSSSTKTSGVEKRGNKLRMLSTAPGALSAMSSTNKSGDENMPRYVSRNSSVLGAVPQYCDHGEEAQETSNKNDTWDLF